MEDRMTKIINMTLSVLLNTKRDDYSELTPEQCRIYKDVPYIVLIRPFVIEDLKFKHNTFERLSRKYKVTQAQIKFIKIKYVDENHLTESCN